VFQEKLNDRTILKIVKKYNAMSNGRLYLFTLCALFGAIYGQTPVCLNGGPPGRMPNNNQFCTNYNSKSCCPTSASFLIINGGLTCGSDDGCGTSSLTSCASMLYDLFCAKQCDSQITQFSVPINFFGRNYSLCSTWTDKLISACGNVQYCNTTTLPPNFLPMNCLSNNALCVSSFLDNNFVPLTGSNLIYNHNGPLYRAATNSAFLVPAPLSGSDDAYISTGNSPSCFNGPNN